MGLRNYTFEAGASLALLTLVSAVIVENGLLSVFLATLSFLLAVLDIYFHFPWHDYEWT